MNSATVLIIEDDATILRWADAAVDDVIALLTAG